MSATSRAEAARIARVARSSAGGRSHGLAACGSDARPAGARVQRPDQDAHGAYLRKKKRNGFDHARAMIEWQETWRRPPNFCGVHPTTFTFRWRHRFLPRARFRQAPDAERIVEADETFILEILQGPMIRPCRERRASEAERPDIRPSPGQYSCSRRRRAPEGRDLRRRPASSRQRFGGEPRLAGVVTPSNHLIGDCGEAIAAFARKAGIPFHAVPSPGSRPPRLPPAHQYRQRLPQPSQAMADAFQRRRHQEPAQLSRRWRARALEASGEQLAPPNPIRGAIRKRSLPTPNMLLPQHSAAPAANLQLLLSHRPLRPHLPLQRSYRSTRQPALPGALQAIRPARTLQKVDPGLSKRG